MRKKLIGITALTAAMALSTGITAFAAGWEQRTFSGDLKWTYVDDNGNPVVYAGWFTDPADGAMYYMDPDGARMENTVVEGYRLGDDGKRVEKTAEDLQREEERRQELKSRSTPAKQQLIAEDAAKAVTAGTSAYATGTTRMTYQAEMEAFMNKIMMDTKNKRSDTTISADSLEDNTKLVYSFENPDEYQFFSASIWKTAKAGGTDYKEQAFDLFYHYDTSANDRALYDSTFDQMIHAALGTTEGKAVTDYILSERQNASAAFERSGKSDTGNSYTLKYKNGAATLSVTCSGADPNAAQEQTEQEASAQEQAPQEQAPSSRVITVGQSAE
ncbi:MAG: hypothetical protein Q4C73_04645 [Eubacteriales bacterium]|nr:hypothetical protein [Eubacteriales bacterium]